MRSLKILVIDDDVDFAESMRITLAAWGHDVTVVFNWLSVMAKLKSESFQCIVADVETPTGNGLTAFEFLNQDIEVSRIPKAFVTGRNDSQTLRRCQEMTAFHVHKSSCVFDELKVIVESIANSHEPVGA